jgi:DNA-binding response OmpR family regulator
MRNKILLIQSDAKLRKFVKKTLLDHYFLVEEMNRGSGARAKIKKSHPDLIIIDIELPDISGNSLCKQITRFYPDIPVIIITNSQDIAHLNKFFSMGIKDYIQKPIDIDELIARVKARITLTTTSKEQLKVGDLVIKDEKKQVRIGNKSLDLTPREYSLLKFLLINKDRVVSRDMILDNVWGRDNYVNPRNVDIYIGYLRKKLKKNDRKGMIKTIRGFGYKINKKNN